MKVYHTLKPIYDENSKILILGSMPSIVSRQNNFYYANKSNRFWKILEIIFEEQLTTNYEKELFLHRNHIALWDTIKSCDIKSSSDSSIKNIEVNNIKKLVASSKIKYIFCTGKKSFDIFNKFIKIDNINIFYLPSSSSANASKTLTDLVNDYKVIKDYL